MFLSNLIIFALIKFVLSFDEQAVISSVCNGSQNATKTEKVLCNKIANLQDIYLPCGDWDKFLEEKCIRILNKSSFLTYDEAENICEKNFNATLLTIQNKQEQDFLTNYLYNTNKIVDTLWIGAKFNKSFTWVDCTNLDYTNWAPGSPKNEANYCAQLNPDKNIQGKWSDIACTKKNLVFCQKQQIWSQATLQKRVATTMKNTVKLQEQLTNAIRYSVPIGYIYAQLPSQNAPKEIWPYMTWSDISSTYAGIFFRVVGGTSNSFGSEQSEGAPHLSSIEWKNGNEPGEFRFGLQNIGKGGYGSTNYNNGGRTRYWQFHVSNDEVRPRNMAIKIWKRTG